MLKFSNAFKKILMVAITDLTFWYIYKYSLVPL